MIDPCAQFKLRLPNGTTLTRLDGGPDGPFWQATPILRAADYADGLEELITSFNRQPASALTAWARAHPLTSDERFIIEYNTSADRANVLRPLPFAQSDRVLEVGCGCGPVSQYLWSRANTLSLDASVARARAAAERLARQPNPHRSALVCADFHQLDGDASFDWVIFNGVLEYAAIYSGATDASPYAAMLQKASTFLRPGGRCIISIENRLGLKYFAGAPEDHYGRTAVGLEGYPTHGKDRPAIRTFSKPELTRLCTEAGFVDEEFLFPFPDYKFAKVIVPNDQDCWKFAAERMIENYPSWRGERTHHFDERAVFRSLAAEGQAGDFAHSFVVITTKPGAPVVPIGIKQLHYFPLQRDSSTAVCAVLDIARGEVRRRKINGSHITASALPAVAPGNSRAALMQPVACADPTSLVQPLSAVPSLWEALRGEIGATTETTSAYQARLEKSLRDQHELYLVTLPHTSEGSWQTFLSKLQREFARADLTTAAADSLSFLEVQSEFANKSLTRMRLAPWTWWAPDWTLENLFPAGDNSVRLFDLEYVDPFACLPTPALVYRQLRMIRIRTAHPLFATHWPWPTRVLQVAKSKVALPMPLADWTATSLWANLSDDELQRHAWFWTKVAEIVEVAMTASVVAPLQRAYATAPWLERISTELGPLASEFSTTPLSLSEISLLPDAAKTDREMHDELARKEQHIGKQEIEIRKQELEIGQKELEIVRLHTAAQQRLDALLKLDLEVERLRLALQATQPTVDAPWRKTPPLENEVIELQARLTETRRQLQVTNDHLKRRNRELDLLKPRQRGDHALGPIGRRFRRWRSWLVHNSTHPLATLKQHAARQLQYEKFPRTPKLTEWPRICIVTPSYQQAAFLSRTMDSVLEQDYPNLAYGVQDGGSTDGSAEIITRQLARLAHAESAPDEGQSDAICRGFAKLFPAAQDIMGWINSDDILMPGALRFIGAYFVEHPEVDVVYGHRVIIDETDREVGRWFMPRYHAGTLKWFDLVPQETLFWRAKCYKEIGGLDKSFQFALDWDLIARFEEACFTIRRLPYFLGCFRVHPEQKTSAKILSVGEQEMDRIRRRIHGRAVTSVEIQRELTSEMARSAVVERLHRFGLRF